MLSAKLKAEGDNTYRGLDYLGYPAKPKSDNINYCFIIHCFEENNDKYTIARNMNNVIGNHALPTQPTD